MLTIRAHTDSRQCGQIIGRAGLNSMRLSINLLKLHALCIYECACATKDLLVTLKRERTDGRCTVMMSEERVVRLDCLLRGRGDS